MTRLSKMDAARSTADWQASTGGTRPRGNGVCLRTWVIQGTQLDCVEALLTRRNDAR